MSLLENVVSRIVEECQEKSVIRLIEVIEIGAVTYQTTLYEWSRLMNNEYIPTPLFSDLLDSWRSTKLTNESLAFGILTALKTKQRVALKIPVIELVWTGPYPPSSGYVRSTFAVMPEMIAGAQKSIFLVGYSLTSSTSYPAAVIEQLAFAKKRGCEVKIALHDDGNNYRRLKQA